MLLLDFLLPPPRPRRNANPPSPPLPRGAESRRGAAGAAGAGRGAPSPGRSFSLPPRPHGVPTPRLGSPRTRRHPRTSTGDGAARGAVPRGLRGDALTLPCHRSSAGSPGPPHGGGVAAGGPEPTAETRARLGLCSAMGLWCPWAPHSHPNMQTEKSSQVDKQQEYFVLNAVVSPVITRHFSEGEKKVSQAFLDLEDLVLCSPQPIGLPSRHGADLLLTHQAPRLWLPLTPASSPQGQAPGTVPKHILSDGEELWWANRTNPAAAHCALLPCPHQHVSLPSHTHPSAPPWWLRRLAVLGTIGRAGRGGMHGTAPPESGWKHLGTSS